MGAAAAIKRLRAERDAANKRATESAVAITRSANAISADVSNILTGSTVRSSSPLAPLQTQLTKLREGFTMAIASNESFTAGVRATLVDRGLTELPSIPGYFTSDTPLQRAAEAAAVFIVNNDRVIREAYLRRRGWRLSNNNAWIGPKGGNSTPFDAAVVYQVKADVEPFACFAKRQRGSAVFWPDANLDKIAAAPIHIHPDVAKAVERQAEQPIAEFEPEEQDGAGVLKKLPVIADPAPVAEAPKFTPFKPVESAAPIKWNGNTEEVFETPRLG